jgi:uncharacterized protein (TIGR03085 family)
VAVDQYDGPVSAIDLARAERGALCDLLAAVGPDEPTLCAGWNTRDLAAHLVVREGRPDTALGILGGPLASWTEKVQSDAASQDYEKLVHLIRTGPPIWSAFRLPWVDGQLNTLEYYVHHEDIRRARPGWRPRELDRELQDFIWDRLRLAGRGWFNSAPGGVTLIRTDGEGAKHKAKGGDRKVTISGTPGELVMVAFGRKEAEVEVSGDPDAVSAFREAKLHVDEDHLFPDGGDK